MEVLTSRPEGMDFEEYKDIRRVQQKTIKRYSKGRLMWLSKINPTPQVLQTLVEMKALDTMGKLVHTGATFKGSTKDLERLEIKEEENDDKPE